MGSDMSILFERKSIMNDCGCSGSDPKQSPAGSCCGSDSQSMEEESCLTGPVGEMVKWFDGMIGRCLEYAENAKKEGRPVVGIMCEYTPRELIIAAGGIAICMCGGSEATIASAEKILPSNLCPLIKSTFGYHVERSNPFLEMSDLLVAETTCDGKKKMYEILAETREMYVLELPQKQDDEDAIFHWRRELVKMKEHLEERFDVEITDDRLRDAIKLMNRERA
ncbi:MAG TPA: 2-hydroxyacyl-CoA dehydratase, partial [Phycisphaerae bacterium]|nr:2-hydroxyacyl-CoA dehydratase [Phycisphaerae bacterium]